MFDSSDTCIFSSFLGELREGNDTRPLKKRFMIHVSCFMTYKQFWAEARRFTNTNDEDIRPQKACDVGLRIRMMRSGAEAHLRACGVPASTRTYGIYRSSLMELETRTRTNTNPNGTEANAAGRSGNACALRKQFKCGMIQEGEGHWQNSSEILQKARNLWVLRTPQYNKEEGARAKKLVTCGTRGPLGRRQSVPFSAQGASCSAPEPQIAFTGQELLPRPRSGSE